MKRTFLIIISALALAGLLISDIAWPKASSADEIPGAVPAARAAATPETAGSSVPKEAVPEISASVSPGAKAEEASEQKIERSAENASELPTKPGSVATDTEFPAD